MNATRTQQLEHWSHDFGDDYTERNQVVWQTRRPALAEIFAPLAPHSVLEIGCNRGHNLRALRDILPEATLCGVEPKNRARHFARGLATDCVILPGNAFDLPCADGAFDCVFTAGVLIHVALRDLPRALNEIHRVARRHLLAIEYFSERETSIRYRDRSDLLWKRDFRRHYEQRFGGLKLLRKGFLDQDSGFDRCHWWLWQK